MAPAYAQAMPELQRALATTRAGAAAALGLLGTVAVTLAAPPLVGDPVRWWFAPRLGAAQTALLYAGMAATVAAWAWLGAAIRRGRLPHRPLVAIALVWSLPLLAGPPLFSHDLYSYVAQGTLVHLGLSPYRVPPAVLAGLGHPAVLHAVSPFWRHTTAPYGPLFLWLASIVVAVVGSNPMVAAITLRLTVAAVGLCLLALYLPRLARRLGASPTAAVWLALLNPLVLFQLVAPGHNDLLMAGLMVAGVTIGLERPAAGIAICAAAATVKAPAFAAAAFVAVAWVRSRHELRARVRLAAGATFAFAATLLLVSVISGLGAHWISGAVFTTPRRVQLAITPATALAFTIAGGLRGLGAMVDLRGLESALGVAALAGATAVASALLRRAERRRLGWQLGVALLAFALGGPAAWPWYLSWGIVIVAASPQPPWATVGLFAASVAGALIVKPDGILALPLQSAPAVLCVYLACAGAAWSIWWSKAPVREASAAPAPREDRASGADAGELAKAR
jgi:alpha-1,6-mannosyltransferase